MFSDSVWGSDTIYLHSIHCMCVIPNLVFQLEQECSESKDFNGVSTLSGLISGYLQLYYNYCKRLKRKDIKGILKDMDGGMFNYAIVHCMLD